MTDIQKKIEESYTIPQVAQMLGVNVRTVYRYLENGLIGYFKVSERRTMVTHDALDAFMANWESVKGRFE